MWLHLAKKSKKEAVKQKAKASTKRIKENEHLDKERSTTVPGSSLPTWVGAVARLGPNMFPVFKLTLPNPDSISAGHVGVPNHAQGIGFKFQDSETVAKTDNIVGTSEPRTFPARQHWEITLDWPKHEDHVVVSVADTGVGISPDIVDLLFREDTRYTTTGTQNEKGTGLGLVLCKEFIEKNSGKIWIESNPGVGSEFMFSIQLI